MTRRSDPWFKFYPADWRAEPSLRAVSMAARGLWIEMLCLMHEAEPRGHLLLNGRPVTDAQLAALAGVPLETAQALLGELESAGTFSRTRAGVIYSRRMRADTGLSQKQRANVEKRWAKTPRKPTAQDDEKTAENGNRITKHDTEAIPKKPEARVSVPNGTGAEAAPDHDKLAWSEAVRIITSAGATERSARSFFGKLLAEHHLLPRDLLPSLTSASVTGTQDPQSYLRKAAAGVAKRRGLTTGEARTPPGDWDDGTWRAALDIWRETGRWGASCGPEPGQPGCRVPAHLLTTHANDVQGRAA